MEIEYDGIKMFANIIGGFQYKEKEYAVCSFEDDFSIHKIIILQTEAVGDTIVTKEIPDEDVEDVVNCFQKIRNKIMEEVYE